MRPFLANMEDKRETLEAAKPHWKREGAIRDYGRARSHQLLESAQLKISGNGESYTYDGAMGLAAVITADGYALTAEHVIDESNDQGVLMSNDSQRRAHVVMKLLKEGEGKWKQAGASLAIFPNPQKTSGVEMKQLEEIRRVHNFPGRDLVLIKLPRLKAPYFRLGVLPQKGDWVFASGNGVGKIPGSSAGRVMKYLPHQRMKLSLPSAPGDSGGPIFDERGRLVGIATDGLAEGLVPGKGRRSFQLTIAEVLDANVIERLIAEDRAKFPSP